MNEDLKRIESLIAKCEAGMKRATCANIRNVFQDTFFEAKILRAKMLGNLDEVVDLLREHIAVLESR